MNTTQSHLPIQDIQNDLLILKDGSVAQVLVTTAVNFGLLFETEQVSIINSFAGLLNSLSFPIQIVILSRRLDVSSYLTILDQAIAKQPNLLLKKMTQGYRQFVESLIRDNEVLDKQFYIALNVSSPELGLLSKNLDERLKKALTIIGPRRDHLMRQLIRIGLKSRLLNTQELVKLFYDIYNTTYIENALPVVSEAPKPPSTPLPIKLPTPKPPVQPAPSVSNYAPRPVATNMPFVVEELKEDG